MGAIDAIIMTITNVAIYNPLEGSANSLNISGNMYAPSNTIITGYIAIKDVILSLDIFLISYLNNLKNTFILSPPKMRNF